MKIYIAKDNAGYDLKLKLIEKVEGKYDVEDLGTNSLESVDFPDYSHKLASCVAEKSALGILICGSGNGVSMAANKHQNIRAALCWNKEISKLARQHNDANILTLPARFISVDEAKEIVDEFLNTPFEGGRHQKRVEKINFIIDFLL